MVLNNLARIYINVNSKICFFLGGFFNLTLLVLIFTKTPKEMRIYSKILLQIIISDIANLIFTEVVQPLLFNDHGIVVVISSSMAGYFPYPWNAVSYFIWFILAYFAMLGIVVQFAYRYMILCKGMIVSTGTYFLMVGTAIAIELLLFGFLWVISAPGPDDYITDPTILAILGHSENETFTQTPPELRLTLRGVAASPLWVLWHVFFVAIPLCGYIFVIYSGSKMLRLVKENLKADTSKTNNLNSQLTLNMIIQACIPLLAIFCWGACAYACIFGRMMNIEWFNVFSSLTVTPIQSWISVFNPMVTIITVMPYRRALTCAGWREKSSKSSISPKPTQPFVVTPQCTF